jgi:hypothetical protein
VLLHAMQDSSEMEIMVAKNAQILVLHAHLLLHVPPVFKPEINQSTVFVINVFIHVQIVHHMNNVLLALADLMS